MITTLTILVNLVQLFILFSLVYHYFLLAASIPSQEPVQKRSQTSRKRTFAILIPAHNEEGIISVTVSELVKVDYHPDSFDIVVVADHCTDNTAAESTSSGAICYVRSEEPSGRKGFALGWLIDRLLQDEARYDAFVVLDADSRVNPDFLDVFNAAIECGSEVMQGQHMISNAETSIYNRMAAIDLRLNNRIRNRARENLGFSARLMGDAMCFTRGTLEKTPWRSFSLSEDMEYGLKLMEAGVRIRYVPGAISRGQAATKWDLAGKQRLRWEGGLLQLRKRAIQILVDGVRRREPALIDRAVELLLPPYSFLTVLTLATLLAQLLLSPERTWFSAQTCALFLSLWVIFPVLGLLLDRAPLSLYRGLLAAPLYIIWRLGVGVKAILMRRNIKWNRTPRQRAS